MFQKFFKHKWKRESSKIEYIIFLKIKKKNLLSQYKQDQKQLEQISIGSQQKLLIDPLHRMLVSVEQKTKIN